MLRHVVAPTEFTRKTSTRFAHFVVSTFSSRILHYRSQWARSAHPVVRRRRTTVFCVRNCYATQVDFVTSTTVLWNSFGLLRSASQWAQSAHQGVQSLTFAFYLRKSGSLQTSTYTSCVGSCFSP